MTQLTLLKLCIWLFEKSGQKLEGLKQEVLVEAIQGKKLKDITVPGFSANYIGRVIAPQLWRELSIFCGQRVGIRRLPMVLLQKYERLNPEERAEVEAIAPQIAPDKVIEQMHYSSLGTVTLDSFHGSIPKSNTPFYGRASMSTPLKSALQTKKSSLIFVKGRGGSGKTTLVSQVLMKSVQPGQSVFWCDLGDNQRFVDNLEQISAAWDLSVTLSGVSSESEAIAELCDSLCDYLTDHPCVLVFDHWELLFAEGRFSGEYQVQHQAYAQLLEQISRKPRAGVVVVVTGEFAPSMEQAIATAPKWVKEVQIQDLPPACATKILEEYQLGDRPLWDNFIATYRGNPLKLRLLCAEIQGWYGGSIQLFRQQNTIIGGDTLREILRTFIQRVDDLEREILHRLMLCPYPLTLPQLQEQYKDHVAFSSQVWDAVRSLERRFLLEKDPEEAPPLLSLQPSIKRYLTQEFVKGCQGAITQAIAHGYDPKGLSLLNIYDLSCQTIDPLTGDTCIIPSIIKGLLQKNPDRHRLQEHLTQLQLAVTAEIPTSCQKYILNNLKALNYYLLHLQDPH